MSASQPELVEDDESAELADAQLAMPENVEGGKS